MSRAATDGSAKRFAAKQDARQWAWDTLEAGRLARFPFPPHGRIPNFVGAGEAARRLFREPLWRDARVLKINPDSPQMPVREQALARGIRVYVPTPRLKGGFHLLDPDDIPPDKHREAATLKSMPAWSRVVALTDLPQVDAIVTGCAAVTATGKRAGKGEGYSDLEFAVLRELGFDAVPVATTVHDAQLVGDFPTEDTDIPLTVICTPSRTLRVAEPPPAPTGIRWERLRPEDFDAMPVLAELRQVCRERGRVS